MAALLLSQCAISILAGFAEPNTSLEPQESDRCGSNLWTPTSPSSPDSAMQRKLPSPSAWSSHARTPPRTCLSAPASTLNVTRFHPLFLYESIWNLMNMFLLIWISRRYADSLKHGDIFLTYLVVYPVGRFFLDFLRVDASMVGGININQTIMAFVAVISAAALYLRHRKVKSS